MNNLFGVMQGRLLPKYQGRYQAHPLGYWQREFFAAADMGLDCIEFILDFNDADKNPLLYPGGVDEVLLISEETGVVVKTVCADYFMEAPLHSSDQNVVGTSAEVLKKLLLNGSQLGITDVVIPCVDQSSLQDIPAFERFINNLSPLLGLAEDKKIRLSLETDLPPQDFARLLDKFDSECVTVNYDIGNSAALDYDPVEELECYGTRITDIHIKDRVLNGGPVELGQGNADFHKFFNELKKYRYSGPFIMQAYRDDEGVAIFKKQKRWVEPFLQKVQHN